MNIQVRSRPRRLPGARPLTDGHVLYWWVEIAMILAFYGVYSVIRNMNSGSLLDPPAHALNHANQIISLEQRLGLFHEARIQDWAEHFTPLIVAANYFYGSFHFVVTIGVGIFLFRKWTDDYPRFRNALAIATALALIGFTLYPLTPPRLLEMYNADHWGFHDTLQTYPTFWSFNSGSMKNVSNQFAAMPSVHCAWATWCAIALYPRVKRTWAKVLAVAYPLTTLFVIIITANHYWIDAIGGLIILGLGFLLSAIFTRAGRKRTPALTSPAGSVRDRFDLDHVALAAADTSDTLRFLTGRLGGRIIFGGQAFGFRPMQVWLGSDAGDGMPVELLEPWQPERNDFLARFVARHGAGPHHLTFKVPDFDAALERVRAAGYSPVNIDRSDPEWYEMFLMPREAHGTVVQLASTTESASRVALLEYVAANGPNVHPRWWVDPEPAHGPPATLRRVVLRTPALADALDFFGGVLQGEVEASDAISADLVWSRGARIRLEEQAGAEPGVDRLEVEGLDEECVFSGTRFVPAR